MLVLEAVVYTQEMNVLEKEKSENFLEISSGTQILDFYNVYERADPDFFVQTDAGTKIHVHKCALVSYSKFFAQLIDASSDEGYVKIEGFTDEIVLALLKFIYTRKDDVFWGNSLKIQVQKMSELLKASEKFKLEDLKDAHEIRLSRMITADNCIEMRVTAESANAEKLKRALSYFFTTNPQCCVTMLKVL